MKKFTAIVLILFSISTSAQSDSTKLSAKYVYEDVKAGFIKLVNNLEGPAKHTYRVYVNQYLINGWSSLILECVCLLAFGVFWIISFSKGKWGNDGPDNVWAVLQIVLAGVTIISLGVFCADFSGNIQRIANPEYYAIQDIISAIK